MNNKLRREEKATPVKSDYDQRDYRVLRLDNGLSSLLISSSSAASSSSLCLCVNVGSFSDPENYQGMAHLLEHVTAVQLGFDNINSSFHADTGYEKTRFYTKLPRNSLLSGLERLARILACPDVEKNTILRERETIDNEYYLDSGSDYQRVKRFFRVLPNNENPASKFSCGNLESLSSGDEEDLVTQLNAFRKKHYSANQMTLVVQADLPLETLEDYVRACGFSEVPVDWSSKPDDFSKFSVPNFLDCAKTKKIYKIRSYCGASQMEFKWVLPATRHLYKSKPMKYISQLFDSEKKGSLKNYLRNKKLCYRMNVDFDEHSYFTLLTLNFVLPVESKCKNILDTVFSYVNLLRSNGPDPMTFNQFKNNADRKFRNSGSKTLNLHSLSYHMHIYPPQDYLTGDRLFFEYNPEIIKTCLDQLTPENLFLVILAPEIINGHNNEELSEELWYRIKYASNDILDDWIDCWRSIKPYPEFMLDQNVDSNLFESEYNEIQDLSSEGPMMKLQDSKGLEVWYCKSPETSVYVNLKSSIVLYQHRISKPAADVMTRLYELLLNELFLDPIFYEARNAGFTYDVYLGRDHNDGITFKVCGFAPKIHILLKILLEQVVKFSELVNADLFNFVKSELLKFYSSVTLEPGNLASEIQKSALEKNYTTSTDKRDILLDIEFEEFMKFTQNFTGKIVKCQCLVQGDMDEREALNLVRESLKLIKIQSCGSDDGNDVGFRGFGKNRLKQNWLPLGETCIKVENRNPADKNSLLWNFYQTDDQGPSESLFSSPIFKEFFQVLVESRLFEELRVKDQLGYIVSFFAVNDQGGFVLSIYSPAFKFSTDELDLKVGKFMRELDANFKLMTEAELSSAKSRFVEMKKSAVSNNLGRNWFGIIEPTFSDFHSLELITLREIRHWFYHRFIRGGSGYRQLGIRVQGNDDKLMSF